jgi:Response regulator containing CheY-like receiver, AAA-type ATPase, and DNA-binding domains
MKRRILVVDDDRAHMTMLVAMLGSWGYEVDAADDGAMAVAKVRERAYDVVLTDVRMAEVDGIEALRRIKLYNPYLPVLIMTAYSSVDVAVQALKAGALDYLHKPLDFEELRLGLQRALEQGGLGRQSAAQNGGPEPDSEMIGESSSMRELAAMIRAVAPSEASVLILGESGTGKELVATALHEGSPRGKAAGHGQLRGPDGKSAGERTLRSRERGIHRRAAPAGRTVRTGRRGHAFSGRDRRDGARAPGQTVARPATGRGAALG